MAAVSIPLGFTRDPDFRAALSSLKALLSVKVMMLTTMEVLALVMFVQFTRRFWRSSLTFEVTDEHLIATHQFTGARHTLPWASITSVDKLFSHNLSRYPEFVEELRKRVTCRVFNPYKPTLW